MDDLLNPTREQLTAAIQQEYRLEHPGDTEGLDMLADLMAGSTFYPMFRLVYNAGVKAALKKA